MAYTKLEPSVLVGAVSDALRAAGELPHRGGMVRGHSGFWIDDQGEWVKVRWAAGGNEIPCTVYSRSTMLPKYAEILRAAGFTNVGVICTQLKGEWVQAGTAGPAAV